MNGSSNMENKKLLSAGYFDFLYKVYIVGELVWLLLFY